ncbi:MAG: START domain-containing protein [Nitrospinales bacterium]
MNPSYKILGSLLISIFLLHISILAHAVDNSEKNFQKPNKEMTFSTSVDDPDYDQEDWVTMEDKTVIDAPIEMVSLFFTDVGKTVTMTPGLKNKKILESISEHNRIDYDHYELMWPFQDRFMIYRAIKEFNEKGQIIIKINSVENYPYQEREKVRGYIDNSSVLLKTSKKNPFKTFVKIKMNINPGGWLPKWLVKFHTDSWAKELLKNLREDVKAYLDQQKTLKSIPPKQLQSAIE